MIDASHAPRATLRPAVVERALARAVLLSPQPTSPRMLRERTIQRAVRAGLLRLG